MDAFSFVMGLAVGVFITSVAISLVVALATRRNEQAADTGRSPILPMTKSSNHPRTMWD